MDASSAPLAHYFWIAGVESISYDDVALPQTSLPVDTTIAEDGEPENGLDNGRPPSNAARHSRQNSANRLSKLSIDANSTADIDDFDAPAAIEAVLLFAQAANCPQPQMA